MGWDVLSCRSGSLLAAPPLLLGLVERSFQAPAESTGRQWQRVPVGLRRVTCAWGVLRDVGANLVMKGREHWEMGLGESLGWLWMSGIGPTRLCGARRGMEASLPVHHGFGVSVGGARKSFYPMGCPLAGPQRQRPPVHNQGTVAGDVAQPCQCHLSSGPQGAHGTVPGPLSLAPSLLDHFPGDAMTIHRIPPWKPGRNQLHQSLAPTPSSSRPRVLPRMLTRGFVSSRPKPAHIFPLSPLGQRALRVQAHLRQHCIKYLSP